MRRTTSRVRCVIGVMLSVAMLAVAAVDARAGGGQRSRGVAVVADQPMSGVDIELRVETSGGRALCRGERCGGQSGPDELRIGDRVQICFRVNQPGYISLWSQDGDDQPVQIFPNQYAPGAGRVDATERCVGGGGAGFNFAVEGPPGDSLVFLHYSPEESDQISQTDYPVIRRVRSTGPQPYASSMVEFRIVD